MRATVEAILDAGYFDKEEDNKYRVRVDLPAEPWRDIFYGSSLDTGTQLYNKFGSSHKCVHDSAPAGRPRRGKRLRICSCQLTSGEVV